MPALLIVIASSNLLLGLLVLSRSEKKNQLTWFFFLLTISIGLWTVTNYYGDYYIDHTFRPEMSKLFVELTLMSSMSVVVFFYLFSRVIAKKDIVVGRKTLALFGVLGAFFAAACLSGLAVTGVSKLNGVTIISTGLLYPLFILLVLSFIIAGCISLVFGYMKAEKEDKKRLLIVLIGLVMASFGAAITNLIIPMFANNFNVSQYGPYFSLIVTLTTYYAISKYELFDLKVVAAEMAIVIILLLDVFQLSGAENLKELLPRLIILVFIAVFGVIFIRSVRQEIARREEVERLAKEKMATLQQLEQRNRNLATLQKVSDIVLNEVDFKQTAQRLLDEIPRQVDDCSAAYLAIVKDGHLTAFAYSSKEAVKKIQGFVGIDIEKYSDPIDEKFSKLHQTLVGNRATEGDKLEEYFSPPLGKTISRTLQSLLGIKHIIAQPLYAHGEPLGVMLYGFNKPKDEVSEKVIEVISAISSDMSLALQRAAAFQKLKDANEYLSQLDKMKDEFISMASHELNTPLAAIEGYMSMILDEHMGKVDDKAKEYLSRAFASSKRLASLISDLLNVSRIEQGRLKMSFALTDLVQLAESVVNELQVKSRAKNIDLKAMSSGNVPKTWCDPDRIREVLVNLAGNAIKFTEKGGVTIKLEPAKDAVKVSVIDTGRGIAEIDKAKLFQKFSQVHREVDEHQGTGLGLYISKNFVELHKGKIWVESEGIGKGTSFIFEIPVITEPPKAVDGAIMDGPLSAPKVVQADNKAPDIITKSVDGRM